MQQNMPWGYLASFAANLPPIHLIELKFGMHDDCQLRLPDQSWTTWSFRSRSKVTVLESQKSRDWISLLRREMGTQYRLGSSVWQSEFNFFPFCGTPSFDLELDLEGQRSRDWNRSRKRGNGDEESIATIRLTIRVQFLSVLRYHVLWPWIWPWRSKVTGKVMCTLIGKLVLSFLSHLEMILR